MSRIVSSCTKRSSVDDGDDDADADLAVARQLWKNEMLLPPLGERTPLRNNFSKLLMFFTVYTGFFAPLNAGFKIAYHPVQLVIDYCIDVTFWADIVLTMRTAYYDINNDLVVDKKVIRNAYVRRRLGWDVLANFPFELFALAAGHTSTSPTFAAWRTFRVLRFMRMKKVHQSNIIDVNNSGALRLVKLYPMIIHWVACVWWAIGTSGLTNSSVKKLDWEGGTSWLLRPTFGALSLAPGGVPVTGVQAYLSALYWAAATLIKTAWIAPSTPVEKLYGCIIVSLGAIMFAVFLGQFFKILQRFDEGSAQRRDKMAMFRTFCTHNKLSKAMTRKIITYALAEWNATQGVSTANTLKNLSPTISGQLLYEMRKDIMQACPLTSMTSMACAKKMILRSTVQVCLKNEYVVGHNELVKELFILIKGSLQISVPNTRKSTARMSTGADARNSRMSSKKNLMQFRMLEKQGGMCGLWNPYEKNNRYPYEVQAKEFTTMLNISRQAILENMTQFDEDRPKIMAVLEKEYDLVQNALRLPGARSTMMSCRQSQGDSNEAEASATPAAVEAETDDAMAAKERERMRLFETIDALNGMTSGMNKLQAEIGEVRRQAASMREIMKTLGFDDERTQRIRSSFSINTNAVREKQQRDQVNRAEKTRIDEKREIVRNQNQNANAGTAAAIVL